MIVPYHYSVFLFYFSLFLSFISDSLSISPLSLCPSLFGLFFLFIFSANTDDGQKKKETK